MSGRDPCSPRTKDGEPVLCARGLSQQVALRCAGVDPPDLRPGGALALCWECADDLSLFVGNMRAVRQEWEVDSR